MSYLGANSVPTWPLARPARAKMAEGRMDMFDQDRERLCGGQKRVEDQITNKKQAGHNSLSESRRKSRAGSPTYAAGPVCVCRSQTSHFRLLSSASLPYSVDCRGASENPAILPEHEPQTRRFFGWLSVLYLALPVYLLGSITWTPLCRAH